MFDLENFITNAKNDFARSYTFYVSMEQIGAHGFGDKDRYLVKSTSLPASQLGVAEANWQGNVYKLATTNEYSDFTISFLVDTMDNIRMQFLDWQKFIHNVESNVHGSPTEYMKDFDLQHVSHTNGGSIIIYTLHKAFPVTIGELSLDHGSKELASFDVTFKYQWHTHKAGDAGQTNQQFFEAEYGTTY